ncbi:MAG: hypothetical protein Q9P44_16390 [Anaerolineae bacterium]|nr:hypothetical protein [Anaerolineae bacterium]
MSRQSRIRFAIAIAAIFAAILVMMNVLQRDESTPALPTDTATPLPGSIALYHNDGIVTFFTPSALQGLDDYSFEDAEQSNLQSGILLRDVILLYVDAAELSADTVITVSSSTRDKSVTLIWEEVANPDNLVLFDIARSGTLKLVSSRVENLDTRAEWIQDTDRIEIQTP